jgi:ribosome-binding protein aMBF1 (putative translation factor)
MNESSAAPQAKAKPQTVGEAIRRLREALALPASTLAMRVECDPNTINDIEVGRRNPSPELLGRIMYHVGIEAMKRRQN